MFGTQTLLRFEWSTWSNFDVVSWPRVEMCGLEADKVMLRSGAIREHEHGKGFSVHLLHHEMWLQRILLIFGCPVNYTLVCSCNSESISGKIGSVLRKEKRIDFTLFWERGSKVFILKEMTLVGRMWKSSAHRFDSFCLADAWSIGDRIWSQDLYNWNNFRGWEPFKTVKGFIDPLAIFGRVCSKAKESSRMSWAQGTNKKDKMLFCLRKFTRSCMGAIFAHSSEEKYIAYDLLISFWRKQKFVRSWDPYSTLTWNGWNLFLSNSVHKDNKLRWVVPFPTWW